MPLGKVDPFLSAAFKTRLIPARIGMCLSGQIAKLHFKCSLIRMHIDREMNLQQMLVLFPVYIRLKIDPSALRIKMNALTDQGITDLSRLHKCSPHRPYFRPFHAFQLLCIPVFFCVININIPVIIINRLILIHAHNVCTFALLQHFPVIFFIVNAGKQAVFIQTDRIERCFQLSVACQLECAGRFCSCLLHLCKCLIAL